jgi:hypothetical protein
MKTVTVNTGFALFRVRQFSLYLLAADSPAYKPRNASRAEVLMVAGSIVLGAILFAIFALAVKAFPVFARHMRIGLRLAGTWASERNSTGLARVIQFPARRLARW